MLNVRPIHDRVLLTKVPHTSVSPILDFHGQEQSTRDTMVRMQVRALGNFVYPEAVPQEDRSVRVGSIVYVASRALTRMVRSHLGKDKKEYWILHFTDLDAVES
jgi:co-chaperonin GroES (HSP10)